MARIEDRKNHPSDYVKFYLDILEEYGEDYIFYLDEFYKLTKEALFPDPNEVLSYFIRKNMIKSHEGGIELRLLNANDPAFALLPEPDKNAICSFYLKKTREYLNR